MCEWYAVQENIKIKTVKIDLFNFKKFQNYDLIICDAFLTRFTPNQRKKTVTHSKNNKVMANNDEISLFSKKAKQLAEKWREFLTESIEEIYNRSIEYAKKMTSYPIQNENEILEIFKNEDI